MIQVFTLEQSEQWDEIVCSFDSYDVYWISGYVKAFKIHGDGEPLLFYYNYEGTRGINVAMKRDIASDGRFSGILSEGQYYDLTTPYGYGGWIIEGDNIERLFQKYELWLEENGFVSEFVRFHPIVGNHNICRHYYDVLQLGDVVHMDLLSPKHIWNNLTSKNRNVIRKAIKNNVKIYYGRYPEIYERFRLIYNATMDKDEAENYYYFGPEFYKSILEDLPYNAQVFWAEKDSQVIAAAIMLECNSYMNYHLSGSVKDYSSLAPTNLLLYKAALYGYSHGLKSLYLGGGVGSNEDSLFKFKRAFNKGELNHFYIGRRIINNSAYKKLVLMRGDNIKNNTFFPMYRG